MEHWQLCQIPLYSRCFFTLYLGFGSSISMTFAAGSVIILMWRRLSHSKLLTHDSLHGEITVYFRENESVGLGDITWIPGDRGSLRWTGCFQVMSLFEVSRGEERQRDTSVRQCKWKWLTSIRCSHCSCLHIFPWISSFFKKTKKLAHEKCYQIITSFSFPLLVTLWQTQGTVR